MAVIIPERADIQEGHRWDLSPLFPSDERWEELYAEIEKDLPRYESFRGRLGESALALKEALELDLAVMRKVEKLYTYAHLKSDEDKSNQRYLGLYQRAMNLYTRASEVSSYMAPEIQAVPDDVIAGFMAGSELDEYRFLLEKILRHKPHTRSIEIEEIMAMSGEMSHAASDIFSQLDNADLRFGAMTDESGAEVELSHAGFISFLMQQDRAVRKRAFVQYYRAYDDHRNTIASSLMYSNKRDCFYSRVRKFDTCRGGALFGDNVPEEVYDNLVGTVKKNLAPLFRYLDFRKKALGLDELHFYDTYVPIVKDLSFSMPFEEAARTCAEALAPLGKEYTDTMLKGLLGGWVDRYENRGKRSGAYSSGCYDSPPYILMNYRDDTINSLYTLIHEAGHSMHSWHSNRAQSYAYHDYTIFVAEVASTFNETLLSAYLMKKHAEDPKMRAYIINREIDDIRGTLFRQTMFAEFEMLTHRVVEENRPLTLDALRDIYRGLLQTYFGGSIVIDEELTLECLRIPHFYSPFYVYKYATGISAAIALARKVMDGGQQARDAYLAFLSLGGSQYPLDELRAAGVDMSKPGPIAEATSYFGDLVDQLIELHGRIA
jgi:oligoendopeptidase F